MKDVVHTSKLVKKFGNFKALDGLDLSVRQGEVHGFLGPNGSGKSTTIRILLGLMRKNGGEAQLLGCDPWDDAVALHKRLAYVPGEVNLWPNLSGGEAIDLLGALRGGLNKKRRADLLEQFELDPTKKFRTYSKGNRQKVAIVAAFASDVELYVLDEPTSGLDPLMESVFQNWIKEMKKQGKTVLLSSHILAEVEALCDRLTIIREGKTVECGTLAELRHLHRTTVITETRESVKGLDKAPGIHNLVVKDKKHIQFEAEPKHLDTALKHLTDAGVESLTSHPPQLEELFLRHYNGNNEKAKTE
jgi:ABC-2 type transport system ATP-binding protein